MRVEGHVFFVETFSHFTNIEVPVHWSPQYMYLVSKLDKLIDLNKNDYVRYMYVDLLNLLRLMYEGYTFWGKNSYNRCSCNHDSSKVFFIDESIENNCNYHIVFMININWAFTVRNLWKLHQKCSCWWKKTMSCQSNTKSFVGLGTKLVAECQPGDEARFCKTPEMCPWLLF